MNIFLNNFIPMENIKHNHGLKIAGLEGTCYSGKTTVLNILSKGNIPIINEHFCFEDKNNPDPRRLFPTVNFESAKDSIKFFIDLDKKRTEQVFRLAEKGHDTILMERSALSPIVFQLLVPEFNPLVPDIFIWSIEEFYKAIERGDALMPQSMAFIQPENEQEFIRRVKVRGEFRLEKRFMSSQEYFTKCRNWLKSMITKYYPESSRRVIINSYGEQEYSASLLHEFILGADYSSDPTAIFKEILEKEEEVYSNLKSLEYHLHNTERVGKLPVLVS